MCDRKFILNGSKISEDSLVGCEAWVGADQAKY